MSASASDSGRPVSSSVRGARRVPRHQPQAVDAFEVEEMQILDHVSVESARRQLRQGLDQGTGDLGLGQQAELAMLGAGLGQQHGTQRAVLEMFDSSRRQAAVTSSSVAASLSEEAAGMRQAHGRVRWCGVVNRPGTSRRACCFAGRPGWPPPPACSCRCRVRRSRRWCGSRVPGGPGPGVSRPLALAADQRCRRW